MSAINCMIDDMDSRRKEKFMATRKKVSSKTHTQQQLDDYANQNNPNNAAYKANKANKNANRKRNHQKQSTCLNDLEWFCYGNPFDFD